MIASPGMQGKMDEFESELFSLTARDTMTCIDLGPARYSVAQNPLSGVRIPSALLVPRTGDTSRNTTQGKRKQT
jgi:hypothetical protein